MTRLLPKQIDNNNAAPIVVADFSAVGTSDVVTTQLTTAATANSVTLLASTGSKSSNGYGVTSSFNKIDILNSTDQKAIEIDSNEVFGRLTESAGVYTLSYFTIQSGTETSVTLPAQNIDFITFYNFVYKDYPFDALYRTPKVVVGDDPAGGGKPVINELLTVSATNTISDLAKTPISGTVQIQVRGKNEHEGEAFTIATKAITWSAVNSEYDIETTDKAYASYFTLES